jgi:cyclopropane fatty-acyl-phospholipid synthase-like methyltransferase
MKKHNLPSNTVWEKCWLEYRRVTKPIEKVSLFNKFIFHKVSNLISLKGLKTVELGAGSGELSWLMLKSGGAQRVTMVDYSEEAIQYSKKRWGKTSKASWVHSNLFSHKGEYDVAISAGLLEHFGEADREQVIKVHAALASKVIIVVPAASSWNVRRMARPDVIRKYGWQEPLTKDEIEDLFAKSGVSVLYNERFMPSYGLPAMNVRWLGAILKHVANSILPASQGGLLICYGEKAKYCGCRTHLRIK